MFNNDFLCFTKTMKVINPEPLTGTVGIGSIGLIRGWANGDFMVSDCKLVWFHSPLSAPSVIGIAFRGFGWPSLDPADIQ